MDFANSSKNFTLCWHALQGREFKIVMTDSASCCTLRQTLSLSCWEFFLFLVHPQSCFLEEVQDSKSWLFVSLPQSTSISSWGTHGLFFWPLEMYFSYLKLQLCTLKKFFKFYVEFLDVFEVGGETSHLRSILGSLWGKHWSSHLLRVPTVPFTLVVGTEYMLKKTQLTWNPSFVSSSLKNMVWSKKAA